APVLRTEPRAGRRRVLRRQQGIRPDLQGAQGPAGLQRRRAHVRRVRRRRQAAGDLHLRSVRALEQARRRLGQRLGPSEQAVGYQAGHRQQPERDQAGRRRADALDVRRSAHHLPRVRPRAARHVLGRAVPAFLGFARAARLRRVPVA
ncbi:hypothetical protein LTR94_033710, partial [Friedmanniomyces endolithicus]